METAAVGWRIARAIVRADFGLRKPSVAIGDTKAERFAAATVSALRSLTAIMSEMKVAAEANRGSGGPVTVVSGSEEDRAYSVATYGVTEMKVAEAIVGPRKGYFTGDRDKSTFRGHSLALTALGVYVRSESHSRTSEMWGIWFRVPSHHASPNECALPPHRWQCLWFGWFGFNAGYTFGVTLGWPMPLWASAYRT